MKKIAAILSVFLVTFIAKGQNTEFNSSVVKSFQWRLIGPSMPAGRAWRVVGVPSNPKVMYVTTAGGGLWKTDNNGTTFEPVFNHEGSASTSEVAIAPSDPQIVWVGTGEAANTRANSIGDGLYRSRDGGRSWNNMGFRDSQMMGKISIHPSQPDHVVVAVMGHLWGANKERGLYKTKDGGKSWKRVLFVNDTTGFLNVVRDPKNPEIIYATAWQRFRYGGGDMDESGPGSGIYKSTDEGETWTKLTKGLPTDDMAKIELAVAYNNTNIIYAAILTGEPGRGGRSSQQGGVFRSDNGGSSWTRVNERMDSYYYDHIYTDPSDDNTVWMPVFRLSRSIDGGKTFELVNMRHVHDDLHSMWIDPNDTDHIALSGDGGVSITYDGCKTWQQVVLPIAQFYEVSVDNQDPYHVIGGMQDTGHWLGPHRTYDEEGITMLDWFKLRYNGDGMASATDPRDPNIIYMVQEFGNTSRLDLRTWDRTELQPSLEALAVKGIAGPVRYNWTPGFILSQHDPDFVYLGSNYIFRINGRSGEFDVISPDLSKQKEQSFKGVETGYHSYGTIFSIAESPFDKNTLWAGADDGPLWITNDLGKNWKRVDGNISNEAARKGVVAEIELSHFEKETAYVVYDGHARDDLKPYIFKTTDGGKSWASISSNLPEFGSAFVIREDPSNKNVLYCGTEFGIYVSVDGGKKWVKFNNNLPTSAIRTLAIQPRDRDLIAGTFGRSIWVTDIAPFSELNQEVLNSDLYLFKPKTATLFKTRVSYGNTIEELNGDMFFRADNPEKGTMIKYYLKNNAPDSVKIEILDTGGNVVRTLYGPGNNGVQQVNWDLKTNESITRQRPQGITTSEFEYSQCVTPGNYQVRVNLGKLSRTGQVTVRKEPDGVKQVPVRK